MAGRSSKVLIILLTVALFLGLAVPIYLAPMAFYNGLPIVTDLVPLAVLLALVLSIAGVLYFIFERKAERSRISPANK
jgi:uncharacterized RDD family membrane protein YckC